MKLAATIRVYIDDDNEVTDLTVFADRYLDQKEVMPAVLAYYTDKENKG